MLWITSFCRKDQNLDGQFACWSSASSISDRATDFMSRFEIYHSSSSLSRGALSVSYFQDAMQLKRLLYRGLAARITSPNALNAESWANPWVNDKESGEKKDNRGDVS